jgi:translation initiation factor 2 subunit 2
MIEDYDYEELLARAVKKLPKTSAETERFKLPALDVLFEGKNTIIRNFSDLADIINREPSHIMAYLCHELGTAGYIEGQRAVLKGDMSVKIIEDRLNTYTSIFVICSECKRPDTKLIKEGRTLLMVCEACGAFGPVKLRRPVKPLKAEAPRIGVAVGSIYEVTIEDVGTRGDGFARLGKYKIYVPGIPKGAKVKVKIEKLSGTTAFGKVVEE